MHTFNVSSKKLPVIYPIITSYPEHAHLLTVLQNHEQAFPWVLTNYMQLFVKKDIPFSNNGMPQPNFYPRISYETCPCIDYQKIGRDFISKKWSSFIDFIIDCIDMGYYIYVYLDNYQIKESPFYQKRHLSHPTLIFGYDRINETIDIADFYQNSKYKFTLDSFTCIENAYINKPKTNDFYLNRYLSGDDITLFKFNEKHEFDFDVKLIIGLLEDYINSCNNFEKLGTYESQYYNSSNYSYGISVYDVIKNYLQDKIDSLEYISPQVFYIHWDQKTLMLSRIKYLSTNGYIKNVDNIYSIFEDLRFQTRNLLDLAIKFDMTKNREIINRVISRIPQIAEIEKKAIELLLNELCQG